MLANKKILEENESMLLIKSKKTNKKTYKRKQWEK